MTQLSQEIINIVERTNWPEDTRQDFYVAWLESDEPFEFVNEWHATKYINQRLAWMQTNNSKKDKNRSRLRRENHDAIVENLALDGHAEDPAEIAEAKEAIAINLKSLSPLLRDTLIQYYVEGRSPEGIASNSNENPEAVRKRITRARNILKGE